MSIEQIESNDLYDFNSINYGTNKSQNGCQTESKIVHDVSTQTYDFGEAKYLDIVSKYFCIERVTDLICLIIDSVNNWNSIHLRFLSVIFFIFVRLIGICFETSRKLLNDLNLINVQNCQEWVNKIIENDDLCVVLEDKRGSYKRITFYEMLPNLEMEAKAYVSNHASAKGCYFDV